MTAARKLKQGPAAFSGSPLCPRESIWLCSVSYRLCKQRLRLLGKDSGPLLLL
ncbi:hypothetical protein Hanom_Chr17g01533921 [Helianthus anomalus]